MVLTPHEEMKGEKRGELKKDGKLRQKPFFCFFFQRREKAERNKKIYRILQRAEAKSNWAFSSCTFVANLFKAEYKFEPLRPTVSEETR